MGAKGGIGRIGSCAAERVGSRMEDISTDSMRAKSRELSDRGNRNRRTGCLQAKGTVQLFGIRQPVIGGSMTGALPFGAMIYSL